jgi:hypothetical protein
MLTEMCILEIGKMTRLTDKVFIYTWMELDMREIGKMTNNMGMV